MSGSDHPLSKEEFDAIYSKVPRLTVEIIVLNDLGQLYLTKRAIEPCKGLWHLPGGTVRFGEPMTEAVKRIAERELDIQAKTLEQIGYIEYPSHYEHGLDSPVGIAFKVTDFTGEPKGNEEAENSDWFTTIPAAMHADQDIFLLQNGYLKK